MVPQPHQGALRGLVRPAHPEEAPFDKRDAQLVPAAGSCVDCPKRTGQNKLLVSELSMQDACTDPTCYQAKVDAHVAKTIAAKPKLVQISTAYGKPQEGSVMLPRNKYTEIRPEKPTAKGEATRPEYKTCRFTSEAIVSDGKDKGELRKVCTQANCPVHHPKSTRSRLRRMLSGRPSRKSSARRLRLPIRLVSASLPPSPQPYRCG
jgi:ParB family chromosome partitioning protein